MTYETIQKKNIMYHLIGGIRGILETKGTDMVVAVFGKHGGIFYIFDQIMIHG